VKFLLDINAVVALLKGHEGFRARLTTHQPSDFGLPSIVKHELFYGAFKSQRVRENLARIQALEFEVLAFDRGDAREAGKIRTELAKAGTTIGPYDVLIAGQAIARSMTLVTHNTREFHRLPNLRVEDWQA
jgi:tRNA(fMet)-specific endonuclease VapC